MKYLLALAAALIAVSTGRAMCVETAKNLVKVQVYTCQAVTINASHTRAGAHRVHQKGSSITGVLVTGNVLESTLVWDGDDRHVRYIMDPGKLSTGQPGTFFLHAKASAVCPKLVGSKKTFVSDRPCCDTLPAAGICLVPSPILIVKEEPRPDRWQEWTPDK